MKRLLSVSLLLVACVDNENIMMSFVENKAETRLAMCVVTNDENGTIRTQGVLDVAVVEGGYDGFIMNPLYRNQLVPRAGIGSRDDMTFMGCDIQLVPDSSVSGVLPAAARNFFAPSGGGTVEPGKDGFMNIIAIPRAQALLLAPAVKDKVVNPPVVTVRLRAVATHAGDVIRSGWTEFPVRLCRNCLSGPYGPCPLNGFDAMALSMTGCRPQQDAGNLCCIANNGSLFCPGGGKFSQ